jgi:hypothetical protein
LAPAHGHVIPAPFKGKVRRTAVKSHRQEGSYQFDYPEIDARL